VTVSGEEPIEVEAQVQNQGESAENGVTVEVTVEGNTLKGDISSIEAGEVTSAVIPLTPTPKGEVTLEVKVDPVPGEQITENNEASYTLIVE
jgi:subtilase family serine protease